MKLIQYTGPYSAGEYITIPALNDYQYVHIGVQIPKSQHIGYITDKAVSTSISINGTSYYINGNDVLEFDDIGQSQVLIKFEKAFPANGIIDVVYQVQDE